VSEADRTPVEPLLPAGFEVGVATGSWQVEGAVGERGRSIWDDFADIPGAIRDGATGEPACDHLHRAEEDLDLLAWLGVDAYRFSVSWPRVLPDGTTGNVDAAGLGFYDRLVDGLLARGIRPAVTLYHWDLPSTLQAAGGWPARDTAQRFADYASVVADRLADRVDRWATLNEPWCAAFLGHAAGVHAPGLRDPGASLAAVHHLMLGHGLAVQRLRAAGARQVGVVLNVIPVRAEDEASERATRHVDGLQNRLFLEMLAGRSVPADVLAACATVTDWSFLRDGDDAIVGAPVDWLGENYYTVLRVAVTNGDVEPVGQDAAAFPAAPPFRFRPHPPLTDMGWETEPSGLGDALRMMAAALPGVPLWITENGMAGPDTVDGDGVHDPARVDYFRAHIAELLDARSSGVDVRGYFAWSLLDNLEWAEGWTKRFGIVRVEPGTLARTPKDSAHWWRARLAERPAP
jgi:beta-glucosidase